MADPTFLTKDPTTALADALARYKAATVTPENPDGVTLQPADPRRLHLQAMLYEVTLLRIGANFAARQNLLRYVSDEYIDALGDLWEKPREGAQPSRCTERFNTTAITDAVYTIAAGKRVSDGTNFWAVIGKPDGTLGDVTSAPSAAYVDCLVECTTPGLATNGVVPGQITTLVDDIPGIVSVTNTTETISGRDAETLEEYRTRLLGQPEEDSTAGPRGAYERLALAASSNVVGVSVLGPDDVSDIAGYVPETGEVHVLIIEGTRDDQGNITSVIPDPSDGLIETVEAALTPEEVRPLGDHVIVRAPDFVLTIWNITYYIARSRSASSSEIQAACSAAFAAFLLWQQTPGRDLNPSELVTRLVNAGAKRVVVTLPVYSDIARDQCVKVFSQSLSFGGIEND